MSLNAWIGLVTVLVPALTLLGIAAAVRIGLWVMVWVMGDGGFKHTAQRQRPTMCSRAAGPRASDSSGRSSMSPRGGL